MAQPGIFDHKPQPQPAMRTAPPTPPVIPKQDFKLPIEAAAEAVSRSKMVAKSALSSKEAQREAQQDEAIAAINDAASGSSSKENEDAIQELSKVTEEDLKMAEAMIFNGYAEMVIPVPNFINHNIKVCTTSPEDMDIVDEMIFDLIKQNENKDDNTVNLSDSNVKSARNVYTLALSYIGMDNKDIHTDKTCQLNIIKKAIESLYNYEVDGDIKGMTKMKDEIKKAIRKRSYMIKKLPTPMIDFISNTKYEFDRRMFDIMNMKNIASK
jgi:predicted transcriptional regulator